MSTNQSIILRYLVLLALALEYFIRQDASIFYALTWPTIHLCAFLLGLFYPLQLTNNSIIINTITIEIIPACIGGAAYFLLVCINLATPLAAKTRTQALALSIGALFLLNSLRIVIFSIIALTSTNLFNISHLFAWYFGSTLLVILIWVACIRILQIKSIPAYTDLVSIKKRN